MTSILSEKEYQHFIMDRLSQDNGYIVRKATSYDRLFAMDRELLLQFLNDTQPEEMEALRKIYKADLEDTLVSFINSEVTKARGSLLDVLKHGIEISNMKLELMYTKPPPLLTGNCWQSMRRIFSPLWRRSGQAMMSVLTWSSS